MLKIAQTIIHWNIYKNEWGIRMLREIMKLVNVKLRILGVEKDAVESRI